MVLVTLNDVLKDAQREHYAVGAFNYTDINTARGIIEAAEETKAPVVIQFAESHLPYLDLESAVNVALPLAKRSSVPVVFHLDHGATLKTVDLAIKLGFSSVMLDFSTKPFQENIAASKEVVELAHNVGVSVEGEIGVMNREADDGSSTFEYDALTDNYTKAKDAVTFTKETNVDALAISYGTVHGLYRTKPNLNFDRLAEIRAAVDTPLVVHGGSGLSDEEYKRSVANGITKINYYSTMSFDVTNKLKEYLDSRTEHTYLYDLDLKEIELVKDNLIPKIKVFGSAGRA